MPATLQRLTAWLCLAVALLTGTLPARGFVLCIEADGCVRVELKSTNAECDTCEEHEPAPLSDELALTDLRDSQCPCVDVAFPGSGPQQRILPKPVAVDVGPWTALPAPLLAQPVASLATCVRGPPATVPRPLAALALIRSVVLLV
jgi:hypothetical protein